MDGDITILLQFILGFLVGASRNLLVARARIWGILRIQEKWNEYCLKVTSFCIESQENALTR
jgi:hypothetical protein